MKQIILMTLILCSVGLSQESDSLESLVLPTEDSKLTMPKKSDADLALPSETTATSSVGKAHTGDGKIVKENVGAILDFEGEVIEGERRRPDLFLQISIDNIKFDSLIYNRDDFNDYLEVDRKSRTRFLKMK